LEPALPFDPLVRSYASLDEATQTRQALLSEGIDPDLVDLQVIQDEAGPVEGNFVAGNGRTAHGGEPGAVVAGPEIPYEENFERTVTRGVHLLMVAVRDPVMRERAQGVLDRSGGLDPHAKTPPSGAPAPQAPTS
jgi:hypothetical protein